MVKPDPPERRYYELTETEHEKNCYQLFLSLDNGKLPKGLQTTIAGNYNVHRSTIARLWKNSYVPPEGNELGKLSPLSKWSNRGLKAIYVPEEIFENLKNLPLGQRRTICSCAMNLGVSTFTVKKQINLGEIVTA